MTLACRKLALRLFAPLVLSPPADRLVTIWCPEAICCFDDHGGLIKLDFAWSHGQSRL